jgi:hypothetical protein
MTSNSLPTTLQISNSQTGANSTNKLTSSLLEIEQKFSTAFSFKLVIYNLFQFDRRLPQFCALSMPGKRAENLFSHFRFLKDLLVLFRITVVNYSGKLL